MAGKAQLGKEIVITVANKIGILADISDILAKEGINMHGVAGYVSQGSEAKIMLVVDDGAKAMQALIRNNYSNTKENEVVVLQVEDRAGALNKIAEKLADEGVDIRYIYGTTCGCGGPAKIIFAAADNQKAISALQQ